MGKSVLTPEESLLGKALIPGLAAVGGQPLADGCSGSHAMGEREFGPTFRNRYVGNNPGSAGGGVRFTARAAAAAGLAEACKAADDGRSRVV